MPALWPLVKGWMAGILQPRLKGRFSNFRFFHESVSPGPLRIPWGPFKVFTKIRVDIRSPVSTTLAINDNNFEFGSFFLFCWDAVGLLLHSHNDFYLMFTLRCSQADFVASVSSPVLLTLAINCCANNADDNLSPVTTTPAIVYHRCRCRWHRLTPYSQCPWHQGETQSCEYLLEVS